MSHPRDVERSVKAVAIAVVFVSLGLSLSNGLRPRDRHSREELATLFSTEGGSLRAQLAPPFGYHSDAKRGAGAGQDREPDRLRLKAAAGALIASGNARDAGVASLVTGDVTSAVTRLADAVRNDGDAGTWTDYSAALLTDCEMRDLTRCVDAAGAADRALDLDPSASHARFNRAWALERLGLLGESSDEWTRFARTAGDRQSATDARTRAARLKETASPWKSVVPILESAIERNDGASVANIVAAHPRDARAWAESVYPPAWGDAVTRHDGTTAAKTLAKAKAIGAALVRFSNERMALDCAEVIANADLKQTAILAQAYAAYARGGKAHHEMRPIEAERSMREAEALFKQAHSPMALVARYYLGSALYVQLRVSESAAILEEMANRHLERQGYRALAAQIGWELGLSQLIGGHYSDAVSTFEQSAALFGALNEEANRAAMEDFLADAQEFLGDPAEAWKVRRNALETFSRSGNVERQIHSLTTATNALIRRKAWDRALTLLRISTHLATTSNNAPLSASTFIQEGIVYWSLGTAAKANDDLLSATQWIGRITDASIARRLAAERDYAEALTLRQDPNTTTARLTRALDYFRESGAEVFVASALLQRARAQRMLGNVQQARTDLDDGLRLFESERKGVADLNQRAEMFQAANELFDESIDLALTTQSFDTAFALNERARGRALLDRMEQSEMGSAYLAASPLPLSSIERKLRVDAAIIEYRTLSDRVVIFVVRPAGLQTFIVPITPAELSRIADACTRETRSGSDAARSACAVAAKILIEPASGALADARVAALVPDARLAGFPFGLIIDHLATVEAPSATIAINCSRRAQKRTAGNTLVVAATSFDRARYMLDDLNAVPAETAAIAAMYRDANVLRGTQVTKERLQSAMERARIVHFAGHAAENAVNRRDSRLLLASDRAAGDLTATDVSAMKLDRAPLVYLSACRSASASGKSDGIDNMALAFLVAGAPSVIASHWDIDDEAAASIAESFHRHLLQSGDAASALKDAADIAGTHSKRLAAGAGLAVIGGTPRLVN